MKNNCLQFGIYTFLSGLLFFGVQAAAAQMADDSLPRTASECLTAVQQFPQKQAAADTKAGIKPNFREYQKQSKELGKRCVAGLNADEVTGVELISLAKLYLVADEPALARQSINRRLKTPNLSESELAETLVAAIGIVLSGTPDAESIKLGEDYTAKTDALTNGQLKQKINAHSRMGGYYSYADMDAQNMSHHSTIIKLIDQLPPEERKIYAGQKAGAYDSIALVLGNRGQTEKAIATLQQAKAEINDPKFAENFEDSIKRYSLVGQKVAPVKGSYWFNAAADTKQVDPAGHVTMIQFTAHWCVPCKKSYPAMMKLNEQYHSRGLETIMATELYGYFDQKLNLKPDEEVAADREYFLEHYKMPFKIAIETQANFADRTPAGEAVRAQTNSAKYRVGGIPQIMILDKQGIVRHIMVGWDPANEELVNKEIDRLLKEPAGAVKK